MAPSYEYHDDDAWDRCEAMFEAILDRVHNEDLYYEIARFVTKHRKGGSPKTFFPPRKGGFNYYYRIQYSDGKSVIIRFPLPGFYRIAEEKLHAEVAVMRYIKEHTTIPVPFILHYGLTDESPGKLGPFTIMEYIENSGDLLDVLHSPDRPLTEGPPLNPEISEEKLGYLYGQIADIMIQLSLCEFPRIGSLGYKDGEDNDSDPGDPDVICRPLSFNITQLGEVGGVPYFDLPATPQTFSSSSEYCSALADMHLQQLSFQRNQAVELADDCRKKYIARWDSAAEICSMELKLFRKLAAERRLTSPETGGEPFKLWCDDLRPANILVDENHRIVGVIDWEFTYAAPIEFTYSPPWWLLLVMPEEWNEGLDDWAAHYAPQLEIFLRAMEAKEREFIAKGRLQESQVLSSRMRRSWETGDFWVAYAARKSWAFDGIFWTSIDERFFGKREGDFMERLSLLSPEQAAGMEAIVERKLREKEECTLIDWYDESTKSQLPPDILSMGSGMSAPMVLDGLGERVKDLALEEITASP